MANTKKDSVKTRKIAILVADGVDGTQVDRMTKALLQAGAVADIIAPRLGQVKTIKGGTVPVDKSLMTVSSVLYDAVYIPGGTKAIGVLLQKPEIAEFISQAYKHCKAVAFEKEAMPLINKTSIGEDWKEGSNVPGVITVQKTETDLTKRFIQAIAQHRFWEREKSPV